MNKDFCTIEEHNRDIHEIRKKQERQEEMIKQHRAQIDVLNNVTEDLKHHFSSIATKSDVKDLGEKIDSVTSKSLKTVPQNVVIAFIVFVYILVLSGLLLHGK